MKRYLPLLIFICLSSINIKAQLIAPPGATWKYEFDWMPAYGTMDFKNYGDTLIDGIVCQQVGIYVPNCIYPPDPRDCYYFYSEGNAIYFYNPAFHMFNKIFDYSLNVGDSLLIYEYNRLCLNYTDNMYYTYIKGKGIDTINGTAYRWLEYECPLNKRWYGFNGRYYEKLGFLNGFITVQPDHCASDGLHLNCLVSYSDNSQALPYKSYCADAPHTASDLEDFILFYPNPSTNGELFIRTNNLQIKNTVIYNSAGQIVYNGLPSYNTINTSGWGNGLYFIKITLSNNKTETETIVVNN